MAPEEQAERAAVVAEARTWLGTRFHHEADVKGGGVDCAMLLVRCFVDTGILAPFDPRPYPIHWHLHQTEERYLSWLAKFAYPTDNPQPGDVVIWRVGNTFSHAAIVSVWPRVIHAYSPAGGVEESDISLTGPLNNARHARRYFSKWGKPE
jgi:cell wall-associated NlpC family hydrolase